MRSLRTLLKTEVFELAAIGARIKRARLEAGLRQEDLADLIGMATRTVQSYEAGTSAPYRKIKEIAAVTARSVEWLLHGDPEDDPAPKDLSGQGLALVLDRLESIGDKFEEHGMLTVKALWSLREGIDELIRRLDDEDHREQTP